MSFLAVTGFQAALLALVTTGVIVALYFLKLRHRRVFVASSLLWGRVLDERQAHSLWEKLRRLISIVLAVAIGLLIALAVARPEINWLTGGGERTLLVLDTSPSMLARTSDGQTRWQHAVDAAMRFVNASAPSSEFRVADTAGRVDAASTSDRRTVRESLERMTPVATMARFPVVDENTTQVRFITDGVVPLPLPQGPPEVKRMSVFQEADNVGITAFEIRSTPAAGLAYEAYLEVHNYGKEAKNATLTITGAGSRRIDRELHLATGEDFSGPFDLSRFEGGPILATIKTSGDALSADDVAYAYLPVQQKTKTLLVTAGNAYLETFLNLDSLVEPTVIKPAEYRPDPSFNAYIFDGFAPENAPPRPSLLLGSALKAEWLPASTGTLAKPHFDSWVEEHPVMRYVSLHDVLVDKASRVDASKVTVLAETPEKVPLILASDEPGRPRWIYVTFNLQGSDFPLHPGFPLFVDNALAWLSREPLALRRQPGLVTVPIEQAEIKTLDGKVVETHSDGAATIFDALQPGLYSATHEDFRQHIAVNLASSQYSDINKTVSQKDAPASRVGGWLQQELWFYMLGVAALLIGAEWFTYHKGITL
jgi:Ca-activated chloride channel family protein